MCFDSDFKLLYDNAIDVENDLIAFHNILVMDFTDL
jgi:hypothetical protein